MPTSKQLRASIAKLDQREQELMAEESTLREQLKGANDGLGEAIAAGRGTAADNAGQRQRARDLRDQLDGLQRAREVLKRNRDETTAQLQEADVAEASAAFQRSLDEARDALALLHAEVFRSGATLLSLFDRAWGLAMRSKQAESQARSVAGQQQRSISGQAEDEFGSKVYRGIVPLMQTLRQYMADRPAPPPAEPELAPATG